MSMFGLWVLVTVGLPAAAEPPSSTDEYGHPPQRASVQLAAGAEGIGAVISDWEPIGPNGGRIDDVARSPTDPGVVLAATLAGIYRSADGGGFWTLVISDIRQVHDIEFAPDGTVYAATQDSVWGSTDGGISWTKHDLGIGINDRALEVAIDPNDSSHLWAGTDNDLGDQPEVLLHSTNSGDSWTPTLPPMAGSHGCNAIAINPNDSDDVFGVFGDVSDGGKVWFSNDGGTNWLDRTAGLPDNPIYDVVHDGSRVLVAGGEPFDSQVFGVYESTNDGLTWTPLHDGTWSFLAASDIEVDPDDSDTFLVATLGNGVHKTTDGGASWQISIGNTAGLSVLSVRFAPGSTDIIYLGTSSKGVYRSTDGGATFEVSTTGIKLADVRSITANPTDGSELAAAVQGVNDGGVFTSTNSGANWVLESAPSTRYTKVGFAPDGTLYAISDGPSSIAPEGLYRRNLDGTWTGLGPDQGPGLETRLDALRFSVNNPNLILAGGEDRGFVVGFEPTIWRSVDAGENWTKVYEGVGHNGTISDIEIIEDGTDSVMLASRHIGFPGSLLRSIDGGASWFDSTTGLPADVEGASMCASPADADTVYLANRSSAGAGGLYRTIDGGASWQSTGELGNPIGEVACDPDDADVLYANRLFSLAGIERSEDQGASFVAFSDGLGGALAESLEIAVGGSAPRLLLGTRRGSYTTLLGGLLFSDGFETGDISDWTTSQP